MRRAEEKWAKETEGLMDIETAAKVLGLDGDEKSQREAMEGLMAARA